MEWSGGTRCGRDRWSSLDILYLCDSILLEVVRMVAREIVGILGME